MYSLINMNVEILDDKFNFDDLTLMPPTGVQGGAYFSRLKYKGEKLIIQSQKCKTKNGIKQTGKKSYCDLMFNNDDNDFLLWAEQFEDKIKELIYKNKENWFHDDLEKDDIEYNWNTSIRQYKSKYYLFRTFIERAKVGSSDPKLQIFNEDQERLTIEDITSDSNMICIIEIKGLKFTSQSFHLECSLMQIMLINDTLVESQCLIKIRNQKTLEKKEKLLTNIENPKKKNNVKINLVTKDNEGVEEGVEEGDVEEGDVEEGDVEGGVEEGDVEGGVEEGVEGGDVEGGDVETNNDIKYLEQNSLKNNEKIDDINDEMKEKNLKYDNLEESQIKDLEENDTKEMLEINLELPKDLEINSLKLKKPNEVYISMYEQTLKKAKLAKRLAIEAYLEAKEIKRTYMLDLDEYMDDDLEKIINSSSNSELENMN